MKSALIAIDPKSSKGSQLKNFGRIIRHFQHKGMLTHASIASVIHPSLYPVPMKWFNDMKRKYQEETLQHLKESCEGKFSYKDAEALISNSSVTEDLVSCLSDHAVKARTDLIVLSSNNRKGIPYWILGSFSETFSLVTSLPILVIKPSFDPELLSKKVRIIIAVDARETLSSKALKKIEKFCQSGTEIELVNVNESKTVPDNLKKIEEKLRGCGLKATSVVLREKKSIAHTIVKYAESREAWITMTISHDQSKLRKLFLGSTSRRILDLSQNPFINIRG